MSDLKVSIGICVYNEENNIGRLLETLLKQKTCLVSIFEIYVISSGSTDKTNEIVENFAQIDPKIKLLTQGQREGKASAINLFLQNAKGEILVLESGDTVPFEDTIENLVAPFADPNVGMTGGHSIPVNDRNTLIGFTVYLQWELLHQLSMNDPRFGELIAFRNLIKKIPSDIAMDEAYIESRIRSLGLELRYAPKAQLHNKGPENLKQFINQRRRNYAGHLNLRKTTGYAVSSMSLSSVLRLTNCLHLTPKEMVFAPVSMLLEMVSRALGAYDFYLKKRNPYRWDILDTTKELK
jgi:cellulose synthase/poly-beta-1,6-N-acetylglucosamine synthase-like glycosyltransferase